MSRSSTHKDINCFLRGSCLCCIMRAILYERGLSLSHYITLFFKRIKSKINPYNTETQLQTSVYNSISLSNFLHFVPFSLTILKYGFSGSKLKYVVNIEYLLYLNRFNEYLTYSMLIAVINYTKILPSFFLL